MPRKTTKPQDELLEDELHEEEVMEDDYEEDEEDDYEEDEEESYEDDEYETAEEGSPYGRMIPAAILCVAVLGFVGLGWYAYQSGTSNDSDEVLQIVAADNTAIKERPLDPGGMQFPHQDKSVFDTITTQDPATQQPEIISSIEEPMQIEPQATETSAIDRAIEEAKAASDAAEQRTEIIASREAAALQPAANSPVASSTAEQTAQATGQAAASITEQVVEKPVSSAAAAAEAPVAETPVAETAVAEKTDAEPSTTQEETTPTSEPSKTAETSVSVASTATTSSHLSGRENVQLGAYRSETDALASWKKIAPQHNALSGMSPNIVRADLGDKGVFYRLRVAGVDASAMCAALKTNGQPCIAVK